MLFSDLFSAPVMALRSKLWSACRLGDTELLINSLQAAQPIEEESENCEEVGASEQKSNNITQTEYLRCLNENVGENKDTLLHVAAQGGHMTIIRLVNISNNVEILILTLSLNNIINKTGIFLKINFSVESCII